MPTTIVKQRNCRAKECKQDLTSNCIERLWSIGGKPTGYVASQVTSKIRTYKISIIKNEKDN